MDERLLEWKWIGGGIDVLRGEGSGARGQE